MTDIDINTLRAQVELLDRSNQKVEPSDALALLDRLEQAEAKLAEYFRAAAVAHVRFLRASVDQNRPTRQIKGYRQEIELVEQTAGRALGYPRYCDDQKNFPGSTDADGVCVGDHSAVTIVRELAEKYSEARAEVERLTQQVHDACSNAGDDIRELEDERDALAARLAVMAEALRKAVWQINDERLSRDECVLYAEPLLRPNTHTFSPCQTDPFKGPGETYRTAYERMKSERDAAYRALFAAASCKTQACGIWIDALPGKWFSDHAFAISAALRTMHTEGKVKS